MQLYQIMFYLFLNFKDEQYKLPYRFAALLTIVQKRVNSYLNRSPVAFNKFSPVTGIQKENKIPGTQNESKTKR